MGNEHSKPRLRRRSTVGSNEHQGKQARHRQRRQQHRESGALLEEGWVILDNGGKGLNDGNDSVIISVAALEPLGGDGSGAEESEEHRAEPSPNKEKGKEKEKAKENRRSGDEGDAGGVGHNDGDDFIAVGGDDVGSNSAAERKAKERKEGAKAKKGHKKGKKKEHKEHRKEKKSKKVVTTTPRASRDVAAADIMPDHRGGVEGEVHREYDDLPELVAEFDDNDADRLGDAAAVSIEEEKKEEQKKKKKKKEKEKEKEHDEFDIVSEEEKRSEEEKESAGLELLVPSPLAPGQHDPLAATDEDDELKKGAENMDESFIERYLAQLVEPSPDRAAKEEQKEERACLSCDRHFPASSPAFYPLANCVHAYCIDCLYNHLEQQLIRMEAERDDEPCVGKAKELEADVVSDDWMVAPKQQRWRRASKEDRAFFRFVCPHPTCGATVSIDDLKAGFDVFGSLLAKELEENGCAVGKNPAWNGDEVQLLGEKEKHLLEQESLQRDVGEAVGDHHELMFEVDLALDDDGVRQHQHRENEEREDAARHPEGAGQLKKNENETEAAAPSSNKLSNSMKLFLESNEGYVLCPNESCGMIFEHLPPTAEEKAYMKKQQPVDDDGEPIQGDALEHYFDKRFRCRDCSTVFCSACNLVPYHLGFTCADYKNYLVAQHCFVCNKVLRGDITPYLPEDFVVRDGDGDGKAEQPSGGELAADDIDKGKEKDDGHSDEAEMEPFQPVFRAFEKELPEPNQVPGVFFWKRRRLLKERQQLEREKREHERNEAARVAVQMMEYETQRRQVQDRRLAERKLREEQQAQEREEARKRKRAELVQRLRDGKEANITTMYVCDRAECKKEVEKKCLWKHTECGHACCGVYNEQTCLRCLDPACAGDGQTKDDYCNICWVEDLGSKPSIALETCGHVFHLDCLLKKLEAGWPTAVISFSFLDCPLCNERLSHPLLAPHLKPFLELEEYLTKMAVERLDMEGMKNDPGAKENPAKYAVDTFAFYLCYQCKAPYFGGKKECGRMLGDGGGEGEGGPAPAFNPKELICGACSNTLGQADCRVHGDAYMEWKCRFCCSLATYFCGGKARFCTPCHDRPAERVEFANWKTLDTFKAPACGGAASCPLHVDHPPNGTEEFCLGCSMCKASGFRFNATTASTV